MGAMKAEPAARQAAFDVYREASAKLQERLRALQERQEAPARERTQCLRVVSWSPYDEQRRLLRSSASEKAIVAGRQVGKSDVGAYATLRVALAEPGSYSVLLAPTFPIARTAIDKMRALCREVPGAEWKEQQKRMLFANGSVWQVFSADHGDNVGRGPTLTGLLWVDEAAMVSHGAWQSTLGSLTAVRDPRKLLTTTPKGKNWVWGFVTKADMEPGEEDDDRRVWRFRSEHSPFANLKEIRRNRRLMTPEMAVQEYDAEFVDALILAFPDVSRLWVNNLQDRSGERDLRVTAGIDLGKEQDWTVVTVMNKYGEARIVGRWQHQSWPETEKRILELAEAHGVDLFCVDKSGVGSYLVDRLERVHKRQLVAVQTHLLGAKAEIVELARADAQNGKIRVERGQPSTPERAVADQLEHELKRFQGTKYVRAGNEYVKYEGVQIKGEHDDCVISLCLANWGREHGWAEPREPLRLKGHLRSGRTGARTRSGSSPPSYIFGQDREVRRAA